MAGENEEHVDTDKASLKPRNATMKSNHDENGNPAQSLDVHRIATRKTARIAGFAGTASRNVTVAFALQTG